MIPGADSSRGTHDAANPADDDLDAGWMDTPEPASVPTTPVPSLVPVTSAPRPCSSSGAPAAAPRIPRWALRQREERARPTPSVESTTDASEDPTIEIGESTYDESIDLEAELCDDDDGR